MKFHLTPSNRGITNDELLADLRRVAALLDTSSLSRSEYDAHGRSCAGTIEQRFKGWNKALIAAGLEPKVVVGITPDQLFSNLLSVWEKLGRQPTYQEMQDRKRIGSKFSVNTYVKRFGSWRSALEAFVQWANLEERPSLEVHNSLDPTYSDKGTRAPSLRLRFKVMQRDCFKCQYCGKSPATHPGIVLHLDHKHPYSQGGETTFDNLITACSGCNLGKGDFVAGGG